MDTMTNPITPPLPSPSFAVPSLDTLPSDILLHIASDSDESTLWAMRATCHALRNSTEKALKPFLEEKRVTVKPEFVIDAYNAIPPLSPADDTARHAKLQVITQKFSNHLASFPPSSTLLMRLVIEVQDDAGDAGWAQLAKLAPQLEEVEIHIFDRFWQRQPIPANHPKPIQAHFIPRDHLYPSLLFSLLTSLTVFGTARVMQHLYHVARFAPNLRALTLGNHWSRDEDAEGVGYLQVDMTCMILISPPALLRLEDLNITGSDVWMRHFIGVSGILYDSPRLCNLTIHRLCSWRDDRLDSLAFKIGEAESLSGIAVYGVDALDFVRKMESAQQRFPAFRVLTTLTVELSDTDADYLDPMMSDTSLFRPSFPSLKRMTWVNRRTPDQSQKRAYEAKYNKATLLRLLRTYPSLLKAQCLAEYPDNPFAPEYPANPFAPVDLAIQAQGSVLCCVDRADEIWADEGNRKDDTTEEEACWPEYE